MPIKLEFKRSINNKSFLFCLATVLLSFILGYILLVSIDKVENVTIDQLFFSVYTVITQLGIMIFSIVIIYSISLDYKEKNILFYKSMGINSQKYFLMKIAIMIFWFSVAIILYTLGACILYNDFSKFYIMVNYFENVIIYIVLITSLFSFLFENMMGSFCVNLAFWIFSIVLFTASPKLKFIAFFDASNEVYINLDKFLSTGSHTYVSWDLWKYNLIIFIIVFIITNMFSKRWTKNGI